MYGEITMAQILSIVNSAPVWILSGLLVFSVLLQSTLFVRLSFKEASRINFPHKKLKTAIYNGAVTAIGPAFAGVAVMISMMAVFGTPLTWQRLSIIGAPQTELTAANIGAQALGMELGGVGFNLYGLSLALLIMAVNGTGWLLFCTIATPKLETLRIKLSGGDMAWLTLLSVGATIGLFANFSGQRVLMGTDHLTGVVFAFLTQFLLDKFVASKLIWLRGYVITIALLVGIVAAALMGNTVT